MKKVKCNDNQSVFYFDAGENHTFFSNESELYTYTCFIGEHEIAVENGDSLWMIGDDQTSVSVEKGPCVRTSKWVGTVIRGYRSPTKFVSLDSSTMLPYVNGCSTRQLIHAERAGDPTYQMLQMPPGSSEQSHHIHSTARVVYVLSGNGISWVGMDKKLEKTVLKPGMVGIFDPMTPHHFETHASEDNSLIVLPLHIYSSIGASEFNHAMFNGTHLTNHGK